MTRGRYLGRVCRKPEAVRRRANALLFPGWMSESPLAAVSVVLYESQDPINIGAVVRAMKNMGVWDLRLIRPCHYDPNRIEQIAHDTRDVVERIRHFDTIDEALADCVHVVAFSGRRRAARWARHTPRTAAASRSP